MKKKVLLIIISTLCVNIVACGKTENETVPVEKETVTEDISDTTEDSGEVEENVEPSVKVEAAEDMYKYMVENNEIRLIDFLHMNEMETIEIPSEIEGMPVVYLGLEDPAPGTGLFEYDEKLKEIIIPDTVKEIERNSFNGCKSLETVQFGKSVSLITFNAFCDCDSLKEVVIPETVQKVDDMAFQLCDSLTKVEVLNSQMEFYGYVFDEAKADLTLYAAEASTAQQYASEHGLNFQAE